MTHNKTALVLGATGGIGGQLADSLLGHGWEVVALVRDPVKAAKSIDPRVRLVPGDAMNAVDTLKAAQGVEVIAHCVNPPGYKDWDRVVLPMINNTIAAAKAVGARILLPGTVYNFGLEAFPILKVGSPQHPVSRKGAIRVEMERHLEEASKQGVPVLIVRAGDFFGGKSGGNNWFAQGWVTPNKPLSKVTRSYRPGIGHPWAYLPDLAETMALLLDRGPQSEFERYHFAGAYDGTGNEMANAVRMASGKPDLKISDFPWWAITLASPFVPLFREMREMRYLCRHTHCLDNSELVAALGHEPHTPLLEAVRQTLVDFKCI